jgi:hypothetical protein
MTNLLQPLELSRLWSVTLVLVHHVQTVRRDVQQLWFLWCDLWGPVVTLAGKRTWGDVVQLHTILASSKIPHMPIFNSSLQEKIWISSPFGPTTLFDNSTLVDITALPNRQIKVHGYRLQIDHPGMYLDIEIYTVPPGIIVSPHSRDCRFTLIFSHRDPRTIFDLQSQYIFNITRLRVWNFLGLW